MKKLVLVTAIVSALGAAYIPAANAASPSDVAAGALVGGILGYAMGQSGNTYATPYYGYTAPAPAYGYSYVPGYESYYGYEAPVTPIASITAPLASADCSGMFGSSTVLDNWGNVIGVRCPDGTVEYY